MSYLVYLLVLLRLHIYLFLHSALDLLYNSEEQQHRQQLRDDVRVAISLPHNSWSVTGFYKTGTRWIDEVEVAEPILQFRAVHGGIEYFVGKSKRCCTADSSSWEPLLMVHDRPWTGDEWVAFHNFGYHATNLLYYLMLWRFRGQTVSALRTSRAKATA